MTLPPEMPAYRRAVIVLGLLGAVVVIAAIAGAVPFLRRWFTEWKAGAS